MSAVIRVVALELGVYEDYRRRAGDEFDFDTKHCKVDAAGAPILPKWMAPASAAAHADIAERRKAAEEKSFAAALYVCGNKGRGRKDTFLEAMNAGRGPQIGGMKAEEAAIAASGNGASDGAAKRKNDDFEEAVHGKRMRGGLT